MTVATRPGETREQQLEHQFGAVLTLKDVAQVLCYRTPHAALRAHLRGQLPVRLVRIGKQRGWFATAREIARFLDELDGANETPASDRGIPMKT